MDKLTSDDKKKLLLNAKALNVLLCALGQDEFARVSSCKSAKEAWKLLEATHEGDKDTKATKIALGTSEYENFKMKAGESVQDMNKRFNLIVNNLRHIKPECPKLKKKEELKKGKKKALKVTWDDLNLDESDSDQSQEQNVNACFMASNDEEEVKNTTWVMDSGCSRHMTGTRGWFTHLKEKSHGHVNLGDKSRKKFIGKAVMRVSLRARVSSSSMSTAASTTIVVAPLLSASTTAAAVPAARRSTTTPEAATAGAGRRAAGSAGQEGRPGVVRDALPLPI
ncbi:unnamed protein product [Cuscuta campestris]|uniref:Retrovirus-related Pol polyprotein from transposon TNT 1-94-like beta-barrel domain-containing protein n=1 Tax=Cuscuta campestris TaxID=132261 RepID=A0A484L9S8_9ASTE|nr:unnamed protein product [Cuscuta campestris]